MPENPPPLPDFTRWPSFPFEGELRVKRLAPPVDVEPPRSGEDAADCVACNTPDEAYIWVSERWRVRAMDRPTGLPMVLILECRSHLDLGDLPNLLAAELGVMTVRLERAVRSLDGVARVHVNRWGDGSAHLHMWFLARPHGLLQLRGTFLSLWDDILPVIPEFQWRENLAMVAAWLAEFGGRPLAEPPHIAWKSPGTYSEQHTQETAEAAAAEAAVARSTGGVVADRPQDLGDLETSGSEVSASEQTVDRLGEQTVRLNPTNAPTRDLRASAERSASAESAPIRPATEVDEVGETTDKAEDIQEADKADVVDEASGTVRAAGAAAADHPVADASSGERAPQPEDISPKATAGDPDAATTDAGSRQTVAETAPVRPSADHGPRDAAPSGAGATPRD